MLRKIVQFLTLAGVAVLVLSAAPVYAASTAPAVSTPDSPMTLSRGWVDLAPGQTHIYKFHYHSSVDKFGGNGPSPMSIYFYTTPNNGARLTVRNADQIREWANSGVNEWFGMATPQKLTFATDCNAQDQPGTGDNYDKMCHDSEGNHVWDPAKFAHWEATMAATGDYWLVVQAAPGQVGPVSYRIVVKGPAFQFVGGNQ